MWKLKLIIHSKLLIIGNNVFWNCENKYLSPENVNVTTMYYKNTLVDIRNTAYAGIPIQKRV